MYQEKLKIQGRVKITLEYESGETEVRWVNNTILRNGKIAMTNSLVNAVDEPFTFYVDRMLFGTNGTTGGTPKSIDESRTGLFGPTLVNKQVLSSVDSATPNTAIFTATVAKTEGVGSNINEMALVLKNDDLYSMLTFPDIGKTSTMQMTINWYVSIL